MKIIPKGSNYVPAIGDNTIVQWLKNTEYKGSGFKFFESGNSFFDHKFLLMSAYYRITADDLDHKNVMNYPEDVITLGDSGGFQVMSFGKKGRQVDVTPIQVLRWLENNVDIGMNLDVPPVRDFEGALSESKENFKFFEDNRTNYDFALYNILHGRTLDQIDTWYKEVRDFNFDGWAIGVHPSTNVYLKVFAYLYLIEKGEESPLTNTHFFGVSGPSNMLSLAMLAKHTDASLTFDSSSWSWGSRFRDYWFPLDVRHCIRLGREFANTVNDIPCDCPVCSKMTISELYDQTDPMTPLLLSYHDMYQYIEVNRMMNCMVDDEDTLREYSRSIGELHLFDNINNIFKDFENHKSSVVYERYKSLFSELPKKDPQANLFRYK